MQANKFESSWNILGTEYLEQHLLLTSNFESYVESITEVLREQEFDQGKTLDSLGYSHIEEVIA